MHSCYKLLAYDQFMCVWESWCVHTSNACTLHDTSDVSWIVWVWRHHIICVRMYRECNTSQHINLHSTIACKQLPKSISHHTHRCTHLHTTCWQTFIPSHTDCYDMLLQVNHDASCVVWCIHWATYDCSNSRSCNLTWSSYGWTGTLSTCTVSLELPRAKGS